MATNRNELVSNWRQQLAKAEKAKPASPRLAWLQQTQVRLFRFLLASYSHQAWRPLESDGNAEWDEQPHANGFDLAAPAALDGKPAKSDGQIRSVLTAVAKAQDDPHAPGPLAAGLDPDSWVIAAAASSKLKVGRCAELLRAAGLHARTAYRGDDHMVEVPACERRAAFEIIDRNKSRVHAPPLTPRTQRIPLWCRFAGAAVVSLWSTGFAAWMSMFFLWMPLLHGPESSLIFFQQPEFYQIWVSLFLLGLHLILLGMLQRNRKVAAAKRSPMQ